MEKFRYSEIHNRETTIKKMKKEDGVTVIELLVVISIVGILLAMGGSIASKFAERRSVDRIASDIATTLQYSKLNAGRQGVEYQTVLTFTDNPDPDIDTLTIVTERGNSNTRSTDYEEEDSVTLRVQKGITLSPSAKTYNFNPNGTLGGASGTININPANDEKGERCGRIVVSPLGRIRVIQGSWEPTDDKCCQIYDAESPPSSCEPGCPCPS